MGRQLTADQVASSASSRADHRFISSEMRTSFRRGFSLNQTSAAGFTLRRLPGSQVSAAMTGGGRLPLHPVDRLPKIVGTLHLHKRGLNTPRDHKYCRRRLQSALDPQLVVRLNLFLELALGIDSEGNWNFVFIGEFTEILGQVAGGDL